MTFVMPNNWFSGRRFEPVESKLEPLTEEGWEKTFYASPIDFGGGVPGHSQT